MIASAAVAAVLTAVLCRRRSAPCCRRIELRRPRRRCRRGSWVHWRFLSCCRRRWLHSIRAHMHAPRAPVLHLCEQLQHSRVLVAAHPIPHDTPTHSHARKPSLNQLHQNKAKTVAEIVIYAGHLMKMRQRWRQMSQQQPPPRSQRLQQATLLHLPMRLTTHRAPPTPPMIPQMIVRLLALPLLLPLLVTHTSVH